jgi:hypothetical protein
LSIHVLILNSDLCTTLFCAEVLGSCLGSTANVELLENVSHMDANGPGTDVRFVGNLFVGKSSRQQRKDLRLAGCQTVWVGPG